MQEGSHGTHVAGTVGAIADNGEGTAGVAPDVELLSYQVLVKTPPAPGRHLPTKTASWGTVADAMSRAVGAGAQVMNLSLGASLSPEAVADLADPARRAARIQILQETLGETHAQQFQDVMRRINERSIVVVVAAGNDNTPANWGMLTSLEETITVAASTEADTRASFSNWEDEPQRRVVDVSAPGTRIWSTAYGGGYEYLQGTSMAAPHVAGIAALIKSIAPSASHQEVRKILRDTAVDIRTDRDIGPRADAAAAVAEALRQWPRIEAPPVLPDRPRTGAPRPLPPGCHWGVRPVIDIRIILHRGDAARWLGQFVRFLIDLFLREAGFPQGRFDLFGRFIQALSFVAVGPPTPSALGAGRYAWIWDQQRSIRNHAGQTLLEYVQARMDQEIGKTSDGPTAGTPPGADDEDEGRTVPPKKLHENDPDPVAADAPGIVGVWTLDTDPTLESLLAAFLPKGLDKDSPEAAPHRARARQMFEQLKIVFSIHPKGTWFARVALKAEAEQGRGTWKATGDTWLLTELREDGTAREAQVAARREGHRLVVDLVDQDMSMYFVRHGDR